VTTGAAELVSDALAGREDVWFVGGFVRDELLGVATTDVDLIVQGDPKGAARDVHAALDGDVFSLSDKFGTWRVLTPLGFQVDLTQLRGDGVEDDLALRDFTINAIARPVSGDGLIDPTGGAEDLTARTLRMVSEQALLDDPLRLVRLVRFAVNLDLRIEPETRAAALRHSALAADPAAERVFAELRGIVAAPDPVAGIRLLDEIGVLEVVLPELTRLQGMEQTVYHHKDVYEHTLEVLENVVAFEADGYALFGEHAAKLQALMDEPLAEELTRGGALRWGALLHDIGKPDTKTHWDDGRLGFPGHDIRGAEIVREICLRLHTSERFAQYVTALTRHHMRLGFQIPRRPLSRRQIYEYLLKSEPVEVEVNVLSVADRMATRGRKYEEAIPRHTELAIEMTGDAFDWREHPVRPLIRGDELAAELGIETGPRIGELLAQIAEAQYAGEVATREEAVELARAQ
jgi:putative nucleotidyltransferase with HDIG domain